MRLEIDALFSLNGRQALVTGASSGLGRYFARARSTNSP